MVTEKGRSVRQVTLAGQSCTLEDDDSRMVVGINTSRYKAGGCEKEEQGSSADQELDEWDEDEIPLTELKRGLEARANDVEGEKKDWEMPQTKVKLIGMWEDLQGRCRKCFTSGSQRHEDECLEENSMVSQVCLWLDEGPFLYCICC